VRKVIALTVAASLLVALAGCTASAPSGDCVPTGTPGEASKLVTATGAFDSSPTVDFPTPLVTDGLEVSVISKGDGRLVRDTDIVTFHYTQFDAETGEVIAATAPFTSSVDGEDNLKALFQCVTVGSRVAATLPAPANEDITAVLVIDIDVAYTSKATGRIEIPQAGLPSVVTAPDGQPGVTILDEDPPTALKYATLITGDGKKVKSGDSLLVQYTAFDWDSSSVIATTWGQDDNSLRQIVLSKFDSTTSEGISAGALTALSGKTVGSQVLVVMPASTWEGASDITGTSGATIVVVYDILGIVE